jgi:16S rRNA processing protein RimM
MTPASAQKKLTSNTPGSPEKGEPVYIAVGKIRRPHGVQGEMSMELLTDFPERIQSGLEVFVGTKKTLYEVASVRNIAAGILIRFTSIDNPETAGLLRNQVVYIASSNQRDLPKGRYYHHEIIGMSVFDDNGTLLGKVDEILVTGANDVYVVRDGDGKEILLPAIKSVILLIDPESKTMKVRLQEWD